MESIEPQMRQGEITAAASKKTDRSFRGTVRFASMPAQPPPLHDRLAPEVDDQRTDDDRHARHGAKIVYAFAEATVPKLTVITRKAYGGAYIVMNSKQTGADVNFAYPSAEIAVMGAEGAVNILFRKADAETKAKELEAYKEKFATPYQAAELGFIDEIIYPRQTRKRLIQALEMTENKMQTNPPKKHGNMPL